MSNHPLQGIVLGLRIGGGLVTVCRVCFLAAEVGTLLSEEDLSEEERAVALAALEELYSFLRERAVHRRRLAVVTVED